MKLFFVILLVTILSCGWASILAELNLNPFLYLFLCGAGGYSIGHSLGNIFYNKESKNVRK